MFEFEVAQGVGYALTIRLYDFPTVEVKLLELRYLALTHHGNLPSSISMLVHLQYLILRHHHNIKVLRNSTCWPEEISDMHATSEKQQVLERFNVFEKLVYLRNLPDPPREDHTALPKLSTLHVSSYSCTEAVFIIELQPDNVETLSCFMHIGLLERLHSLKCVVVNPRQSSKVVAPPHHLKNLPKNVKKLNLNGMRYSWVNMQAIGLLPRLKVLKLRYSAFQGPVWITMGREFQSLEFLLLEDLDLVHWITDDDYDCFPNLQCLIIRHCYKLKDMPSQIGSIPTLKRMEVVDSSPSIVATAQQIKEEINHFVQVVIISSI